MTRTLSIAMLAVSLTVGCTSGPKSPADSLAFSTRFRENARIDQIPEGVERVRIWMPLAESDTFQSVTNLQLRPEPLRMERENTYGNRIAYWEFERPDGASLAISMSFELLRREKVAAPEATPPGRLKRYLEPDRLGVIDKRIRDMAVEITEGRRDTMDRARAIYDYVLEHMEYNKEAPGWGRGDTARACSVGKGNCSDYHSLFISLARATGIPARFHYGFALKPGGEAGPHCWAEFRDPDRGWVPVDISEADKDPSRADYFFGHLSTNRVLLSTGRDIVLAPPQNGRPLNFLILPHVEVDGQPHDRVTVEASHESGASTDLARASRQLPAPPPGVPAASRDGAP